MPDTKSSSVPEPVVVDPDPDGPFILVDGKKEMKDGSGMIKEGVQSHD